jgi:hypothetical protein
MAKFYVQFEPVVGGINFATNRLYNFYERDETTTQHKYSVFEMRWHTRKNQISSFGETD